jgi:hypothetical protein
MGFYCEGGARQACPAGRYSDQLGTVNAAACVPCPSGTFSAATAATMSETCEQCGPLDNSSAGSVACWPGVVSAVAFNPPPVTPGFSVGDVVVVNFSSPTNTSAVVSFVPPAGTTSRSWRAGNRELWFVVTSAVGVNTSAVEVATGLLSVSVSGVFSADGASPSSVGVTLSVGGTWGVPSPPVIVDVVAFDTGRNVGLGTNDTLVVTFDQAVRQVPGVQSPAGLAFLLAFLPPLPSAVIPTGAWTSLQSLTVSLAVSGGVVSDWAPWNVGSLSVAVRPAANFTSANGESGASSSSAVVRGGSWGDAVGLIVSPKNATAVVVTVALPATAVGYAVSAFVVQWSTADTFAGAGTLPSSMAELQAWVRLGTPSAPAVDSGGRVVGTVVLLSSSSSGSVHDVAVVTLSIPAPLLSSPLQFDVPRLITATTYFVRGTCNGPSGAMGPVVPSDPPFITPQPPLILRIDAPSAGLPTAGGVVLEAMGEQLGALSSAVFLVLSSAGFEPFTSPACAIVVPASRIRCTSPEGVGMGLHVAVSVDGVLSSPYPNRTLSYSSPAITGLRVAAVGGGGIDGDMPTTGGGLVMVEGVNFGPAALGARSLGAVSYSPTALSLTLGAVVSFPALDCAITRNHTEVTCRMGPGVGGGLQWGVTIAGQSAVTATTAYRRPVITAIGVVAASGIVSSDPAALEGLATKGGQLLVRQQLATQPSPIPATVGAFLSVKCPPQCLLCVCVVLMCLAVLAGVHWGLLWARWRAAVHRGLWDTGWRGSGRRHAAFLCMRSCWSRAHRRVVRQPSRRGHRVHLDPVRSWAVLCTLNASHIIRPTIRDRGDGGWRRDRGWGRSRQCAHGWWRHRDVDGRQLWAGWHPDRGDVERHGGAQCGLERATRLPVLHVPAGSGRCRCRGSDRRRTVRGASSACPVHCTTGYVAASGHNSGHVDITGLP